jgi:hypothetical protein
VSILGRKHILEGGELADCVVRDVEQRAGDALRVVIDTFDGEVIVAGTVTADRRTGAGAKATAAGHAGTEKGD